MTSPETTDQTTNHSKDALSLPNARSYQRVKLTMSIVSMALNVVIPLVFLLSGGSEAIRNLAEGWTSSSALVVVLFLLVTGVGFQIIEFPLEMYSGFIVEKQFGLGKVSIGSWIFNRVI